MCIYFRVKYCSIVPGGNPGNCTYFPEKKPRNTEKLLEGSIDFRSFLQKRFLKAGQQRTWLEVRGRITENANSNFNFFFLFFSYLHSWPISDPGHCPLLSVSAGLFRHWMFLDRSGLHPQKRSQITDPDPTVMDPMRISNPRITKRIWITDRR